MITLRPYQEHAVDSVMRAFGSGRRGVLLVLATGGGKTITFCRIIQLFLERNARVLVLAHRSELIEQASVKLGQMRIEHGIIKAGLDRGTRRERCQVASVQTYVRRSDNLSHHFDLIIRDEAHHAPAGTDQLIRELNANPLVLGVTATPYRTDGKPLGNVFDHLINVADTSDLITEGFLVPPRLFRASITPDLLDVRTVLGDYDEAQLSRKMRRPKLIGHAVQEYCRIAYGMRGVGFCVDVAHSQECTEAFRAAGIAAEHLDGTTPAGERAGILRRLKTGQTTLVFNCGVLTEGFDEPTIEVVLALRPTQSRCLWRQMIGRGLRISPETAKRYCYVMDHAGWTDAHGYITDPDVVSLDAGLKREQPPRTVTCKACGAQLAGRPPICPACGAEIPTSSLPRPEIGLGDGRFSLSEDVNLFTPRQRPHLPARPKLPAGKPSIARIRR